MSKIRYESEDGEVQLIDIPQELINQIKNDSYNQAIKDFFNKCKELSYKESLETDSSVEFAIVELDDIEEAVEQLKK